MGQDRATQIEIVAVATMWASGALSVAILMVSLLPLVAWEKIVALGGLSAFALSSFYLATRSIKRAIDSAIDRKREGESGSLFDQPNAALERLGRNTFPERMDRFVERHLARWDIAWVPLGALAIVGVVLAFLWMTANAADRTSVAVAGATGLVAWTAITSAWQARRQANATRRTAEIALNAELNSAVPIVDLNATSYDGRIRVELENIGRGPALNLQLWLNHTEAPPLARANFTAIGANQSRDYDWQGADMPRLELGLDILAQYEDVHRRVFETRLEFVANAPPLMHYGATPTDKRRFF